MESLASVGIMPFVWDCAVRYVYVLFGNEQRPSTDCRAQRSYKRLYPHSKSLFQQEKAVTLSVILLLVLSLDLLWKLQWHGREEEIVSILL